MLILFNKIALWVGYFHIAKFIFTTTIAPALKSFWDWNVDKNTLLSQWSAFLSFYIMKKGTGYMVSDRMDEISYARFIEYFETARDNAKWCSRWMEEKYVRWLKAERLKKYPNFHEYPKYQIVGTKPDQTAYEVWVQASDVATALLIAKELNPLVNFSNMNPGWADNPK
jgi:hypothetical protein